MADFLADNTIIEEIERETEFPDNEIMSIDVEEDWKLYFNGAANKNGYGTGILLISPEQIHYSLSFQLQFDYTNNTTEYEAYIVGL